MHRSVRGCPISGKVLEGIDISYGSRALLERFFHFADGEARERGVTLSFASFSDLLAVNREQSASWRPLVPIFHEEVGGVGRETGFVLLGRNADGEVVATQAARFYDWSRTDLAREASSLRMFYADAEAAAARGDRCEITSPSAKMISGRVVFSGAGWYRPDFRGKGLATILPRISRAYAFTRWNSDYTISMIGDKVIAGGMAQRCGYSNIEKSSVALVASPLGELRCALVWMGSDELLEDLEASMRMALAPLVAEGQA